VEKIKVIVSGGAGKMGRSIVRAVSGSKDLILAGVADLLHNGEDAGTLAGIPPLGIKITSNLDQLLNESGAAVMIDFTTPLTVMENIRAALQHHVSPVVGTTGITADNLVQIEKWVKQFNTGAIIAPNFALGAILMIKAAQLCARYLKAVEIIELHHDEKLDSPSGTAINTAHRIFEATGKRQPQKEILEKVPGARGGTVDGIPIHSVRLPGLIAHQEVIFGDEGQILTLRHDAMDRSCFMPGLLLAVRRAPANKDLIYGMENLLD
jgi:4-hydroxy-tetrahydrodipicolinate reductase